MSLAGSAITLGQHLPWVNLTLDYTEQLVGRIPRELLEFRPLDPLGGFFFSPAEIAMHLADERREFARMLDGSDSRDGFWTIANWETDGDGAAWQFRPCGSVAELLGSLREARAELAPWLSLPVEELHSATPGTQVIYDKQLARFREQGVDTSGFELRGPATVNRVLFSLTVHESGHRGYLQTVLRLQGVDARGGH